MNLRSTKALVEKEGNNMTESELTDNDAQYCYHVMYNIGEEIQRKMHSDQTG